MTEQSTETETTEPVTETADDTTEETPETEPETFPREYVEKLRREAAEHRTRAGDRDGLAQRLHSALVAATGRLADPDALTTAIDDLLTRKPHLASRRVAGDVGQGAARSAVAVDLAGMLRRNAS